MIGRYRIYDGDRVIADSTNVITDAGKDTILRYLSGNEPAIADAVVFGIADNPATEADERLGFEYHRTSVDLIDYKTNPSKLVFRGIITDALTFELHEVGIVVRDDLVDEETPSHVITDFDPGGEEHWENYTVVTTNVRIGTSSMRISSEELYRPETPGIYEGIEPQDEFALAYRNRTGSGDITVTFYVDSSNYQSYTFTPSSGFNVERWTKADFVETGTAPWTEFTAMGVTPGGTTAVTLESMRIDRIDPTDGPVLVSRSVLDTPIEKSGTKELQVEYEVEVGFGT